ncbi:hypothetical protein DPMN_112287 [Dreissena polymorpha]|uniref:Uncharacterized protein n=1 Tax=Dreissena polymorpha TaxID=45954 RepID=A0A9D4KG13_DREPO|nr:hypothetical protein DPMN_112287 [Dreissena polymorpha]
MKNSEKLEEQHFFDLARPTFELGLDIIKIQLLTKFTQDINGTNVRTKFHKERTTNGPLRPYIIGTHFLTKFHEDPTINVAATVLTRLIFMTHNGRQTIDKR